MKSKLDNDISKIVNSNQFQTLFETLSKNLARSPEDRDKCIRQLNYRMVSGYYFSHSDDLQRNNINIVSEIAKVFPAKNINITQLTDIAFQAFSESLQEGAGSEITLNQYKEKYKKALYGIQNTGFNYRARCELFEFCDGIEELNSKYVSILDGEKFTASWNKTADESLKAIVERNGDYSPIFSNETEDYKYTFPIRYWEIKCDSIKSNARTEAAWMAGIFVSFIRLALRPANYCHRPRLGCPEPCFGEKNSMQNGMTFRDNGSADVSLSMYGRYKIDRHFQTEFNSNETQDKLSFLFEGAEKTLASRMANCLGWLSKARQCTDYSQRLLYNFTALESLFSETNTTAPVMETISRYVSIILGKTPKNREAIFKEIKRLYGFRSSLVHRGLRNINQLDSNSVERFVEYCAGIILEKCPLDQDHCDFLAELKKLHMGIHGLQMNNPVIPIPPKPR